MTVIFFLEEFKMENFSIYFLNNLSEEGKRWFIIPNGVYRVHVKLWDNTGEVHVTIWTECKFVHRMLTPSNMLLSSHGIF